MFGVCFAEVCGAKTAWCQDCQNWHQLLSMAVGIRIQSFKPSDWKANFHALSSKTKDNPKMRISLVSLSCLSAGDAFDPPRKTRTKNESENVTDVVFEVKGAQSIRG